MESKAILRLSFQILLAISALAALPVEAVPAPSATESSPAAEDVAYQKLMDATSAVVAVKVKAIANARSNESLGQERLGSGVMIGKEGMVLTIGYLILEADEVEVTDSDGATVPATVVAYDHATGFGLVKPVVKLSQKPIRLGTAMPVAQLDRLMIVNGGAEQTVSIATVVSKRKFAG